jgi:hypothetical protein
MAGMIRTIEKSSELIGNRTRATVFPPTVGITFSETQRTEVLAVLIVKRQEVLSELSTTLPILCSEFCCLSILLSVFFPNIE